MRSVTIKVTEDELLVLDHLIDRVVAEVESDEARSDRSLKRARLNGLIRRLGGRGLEIVYTAQYKISKPAARIRQRRRRLTAAQQKVLSEVQNSKDARSSHALRALKKKGLVTGTPSGYRLTEEGLAVFLSTPMPKEQRG